MKLLAQILRKTVRLNKTRRAFDFMGRGYILAVRSTKSRGYGVTPAAGVKPSREFTAIHMGYITLYRSVMKHTLKENF